MGHKWFVSGEKLIIIHSKINMGEHEKVYEI